MNFEFTFIYFNSYTSLVGGFVLRKPQNENNSKKNTSNKQIVFCLIEIATRMSFQKS